MTGFQWKITDITSKDGAITHAKYFVEATDNQNTVQAEGHWYFNPPKTDKPLGQVTEDDVIGWIVNDAVRNNECHIKSNLVKQLEALSQQVDKKMPWKMPTFTVSNL